MTDQLEVFVPPHELFRRADFQRWMEGQNVPWVQQIFDMLDYLDSQVDYSRYQVKWSPRIVGSWELENITTDQYNYQRLYHVLQGEELSRDPGWGDFTVLRQDGEVWMSDTRAEILEHLPFIEALHQTKQIYDDMHVLINGLGIGMAVNAALLHGATQVDVVEVNQDVIDIIAPNFAGKPVTIHHADALTIKWPVGTSWHVAWSDIWPSIDDRNLVEMNRLTRKYQNRTFWHGHWQREGCERMKREIAAGNFARI